MVIAALIVPPAFKVTRKNGNFDALLEATANRMEPAVPWQFVIGAVRYQDQLAEMQRLAARAFEAVGGEGLARVDFFYTGTEFFVNEVNTMPGFTPISMFPTCWIASGLSYPDLITELVELALER